MSNATANCKYAVYLTLEDWRELRRVFIAAQICFNRRIIEAKTDEEAGDFRQSVEAVDVMAKKIREQLEKYQ